MGDFDNKQIDFDNPLHIEKLNNRKLSADKIKQILNKVLNNPSDSAKRWVWELMQNAKDVPNVYGRVSIKITLESDKLVFEHNGDPFSLSNIFSLIQQVSSKDSTNSDEDVTGKFGTGFIATHLLSEVIEVSGIILHKGVYRKINTQLDRSGKTSEELIPKIDEALKPFYDIENDALFPRIDNYEGQRNENSFDTKFIYPLDTVSQNKAAINGFSDLVNTLPVTLVNIPKIKSVLVRNTISNTDSIYESDLVEKVDSISKLKVSFAESSNVKSFKNYLTFSNENVRLTLEVDDFSNPSALKIPTNNPKLFRDFPLIGSDNFHFPFLLNGFRFNPTDDRDGIVLHGGDYAKLNREIIDDSFEASREFINWLVENGVQNRFVFALSRLPDEKWEEFSKEWYLDLQSQQREYLINQPLVETTTGHHIKLMDSIIPVFGSNLETRLAFYELVKPFVGEDVVPKKEHLVEWIGFTGPKSEIESWGEVQIRYSIENLLEEIQELENLVGLSEKLNGIEPIKWLNNLFEFIIDEKIVEYFDEFAIIPNHKDCFLKLENLFLEDIDCPIPNEFLEDLRRLLHDWGEQLIHKGILLPGQNIEKRGLNDLSETLNLSWGNKVKDEAYRDIILNIIGSTTANTNPESVRLKIFRIMKELFRVEKKVRKVSSVKGFNFDIVVGIASNIINENIDERGDLKSLAEDLGKSFDKTIIWYNEYLEILEGSEKLKHNLEYQDIIPNRKGDFCAFDSVYGFGTDETPLSEELIGILKELDSSKDWMVELIHDGFSLNLETKKFEELGNAIDERLLDLVKDDTYNPGSISVYKSIIYNLINWAKNHKSLSEKYLPKTLAISNELWVKFSMTDEIFDIIREEDNIIMLKELKDANINSDELKSLIQVKSKLDSLGLEGLEELLNHGKELIEIKEDFEFKKIIGEKVEELFKQSIEGLKLDVNVKYKGLGSHDFEITSLTGDFNPLFIELKSFLYGTENDFKLAPSQVKKAVANSDSYFICVVERPQKGEEASIQYLKEKMRFRTEVGSMFSKVVSHVMSFEEIQNSNEDIKLVIAQNEAPRIHVNHQLMLNEVGTFDEFISLIIEKFRIEPESN